MGTLLLIKRADMGNKSGVRTILDLKICKKNVELKSDIVVLMVLCSFSTVMKLSIL